MDNVASANWPAMPPPMNKSDGFSSKPFNERRSAITYTPTPNSSISTTPKLPISELEAVVFTRLDIDWNETDYISQVINAQKTKLCAYETAQSASESIESIVTKSASKATLLLRKLVSHTEAQRKQLDKLARKHTASFPAPPAPPAPPASPASSAPPSSQDILGSVMAIYPGCHDVNFKDVYLLPVHAVESHISMYGDFQLQLASAINAASKNFAEMKHQHETPTTVMAVEEKNIQKSDIALLATEIGEHVPRHDHFRDLPGLISWKSDKLVTKPGCMIPQEKPTAFERASTDVMNIVESGDTHQPISPSAISATIAYQSLLDEDDQECSALGSALPTLEPRRKSFSGSSHPPSLEEELS